MGTIAEAIGTALPRTALRARHVIARAAHDGLHRAALTPGDVDLLVNVGLYHDRNLGEPAFAAILQEDIGANPEDPHPGGHGTFSFDIANGACGPLSALQVADGFLQAGTIRHALLVAGDVDPGGGRAPGFPFDEAAGAVVAGWSATGAGLAGFAWERADDEAELFTATVGLERGRNRLLVAEQAGFAERAASWAGKAVGRLLADHGLVAGDVDLVLAAPAAPAFVAALPWTLDVAAERIVATSRARAHTASLFLAWREAHDTGRLGRVQHVVVVAAGAGITAGAALLRT
jgi:3-oxoacyl-[acyl-carrier-protein] synthase-3